MNGDRETLSLTQALAAASRFYAAGRYNDVQELTAQILRQQPNHFHALYLQGLACYRAGDRATAQAAIERSCDICPELRHYHHMDGLLRQQGKDSWLALQERRLMEFVTASQIDAYVISYPKCGRTWLRLMLGRYMLRGQAGDPLEVRRISSLDPALPTIEISHDDYAQWKPVASLSRDKTMYRSKAVALLVRDPRDVLVSYYFQYTRRGDKELANDRNFTGTLSDFVRHEIGGLKSLVGFYNIWAANRSVPRAFRLVRYETWRADPAREFRQLTDFLGLPDFGQSAHDDAVAFCDFANMRRLEETNALGNVRLKPPPDGDPEGFKVRRGIVGGYRDYLDAADIAYIDSYLKRELDDYFSFYR